MNINNNFQNLNFKGYKNLISYDNSIKGHHFSFIAMQLNNDGSKDLDKLRELEEHPLLFPDNNSKNDDTFMCLYSKTPQSKCFCLNETVLYSEENLADLYEKLPLNKFKLLEAPTLKAYDFLAKITKNILQDNSHPTFDNDMSKVFRKSYNVLTNIVEGNSKVALSLVNNAATNFEPSQKAASVINSRIQNMMRRYFHY